MPITDDDPLHDLSDRVLRESLQQPDNLRDFLHRVLADVADGFICERARLLIREFPLDDWRGRESDLLFEIPYHHSGGCRPPTGDTKHGTNDSGSMD